MTNLLLPVWDFLFVLMFGVSIIMSYFGSKLILLDLGPIFHLDLCDCRESYASNIDQTHIL